MSATVTWNYITGNYVFNTLQPLVGQANDGHLRQLAPQSVPPGALGLDGWANRLIVVSHCSWMFAPAWQAIKLRRKNLAK